jgi:hypothetical protein
MATNKFNKIIEYLYNTYDLLWYGSKNVMGRTFYNKFVCLNFFYDLKCQYIAYCENQKNQFLLHLAIP